MIPAIWSVLRCARWGRVAFYAVIYGAVTFGAGTLTFGVDALTFGVGAVMFGVGAVIVLLVVLRQALQILADGPSQSHEWQRYCFFSD